MPEQLRDIVARYHNNPLGVDITEQVRMMYDALINSMDWGSEFLDTDTKGAVLAIGQLLGAEAPMPGSEYQVLLDSGWTEPQPQRRAYTVKSYDEDPEFQKWYQDYQDWNVRKTAHLKKWTAEVMAQNAAKLKEVEL